MGDVGVAREGGGFEPPVHEDGVGAGFLDQALKLDQRIAAPQDQSRPAFLKRGVQGAQGLVEPPQRGRARRTIRVVVQDEDRQDRTTGRDGMIQGGIVVQAQVAAKPKDDRLGGHAGELHDNLRSHKTSAT